METTDDEFKIYTDSSSEIGARDALQAKGYKLDTAEVRMFPQNTTEVPEAKAPQYQGLIEELEDNDDVSDIYEAAVLPENVE